MSTGIEPSITLTEDDGWWVARDTETGVASQGQTREEALENLDEAVALYKSEVGESIDSPEEEREFFEEIGLDPDEIEAERGASDGLPECLQ